MPLLDIGSKLLPGPIQITHYPSDYKNILSVQSGLTESEQTCYQQAPPGNRTKNVIPAECNLNGKL